MENWLVASLCVHISSLAVTAVIVYLILKNNVHEDKELMICLEFHHKFAWLFIKNKLVRDEAEMERLNIRIGEQSRIHAPAPHFVRYFNGQVWILGAAQGCQTYKCKGENCKTHTHHTCSCNEGIWLCPSCCVKNCLDFNIKALLQNIILLFQYVVFLF